MPLLQDIPLPTESPTPTKEELLGSVIERISNLSREYYNQSVRVQREGIKLVFEHSSLTPQEILDALAPDAANVFLFHSKLSDFISEIATIAGVNVELKQPPNAFTVDFENGTVTVTDQPYVPPVQ